MSEQRTTISFTLPLDASKDEVQEVIGLIGDFFGGVSTVADISGKPASMNVVTNIANLDKSTGEINLPWDERIHASSKEKNADGTWRRRRNISKELIAQVEAELRSTVAAGAGTTVTQANLPLPGAGALPALPGSAGGLPSLPGANVQTDFTKLLELIGANMQSAANPTGRINATWTQQFLTHYGVANGDVQNLAHNPALTSTVLASLQQTLGQ